jgi:pimeloyl-ACP methyl ester carboxylesterase
MPVFLEKWPKVVSLLTTIPLDSPTQPLTNAFNVQAPTNVTLRGLNTMSVNLTEGLLPVREGNIAWRYAAVDDDEKEKRPILIFMHAGVTDQTLWDAQIEYLVEKGWSCLTFDNLGFGKSHASEEYLRSSPRQPFNMLEHVDLLRAEVLPPDATVIPVGLSIGASLALGYTVSRPDAVSGCCVVSGGLGGFEHPNTEAEDRLFKLADTLIADGDVQGAANLQVRIWGDGPREEPGRMAEHLAEQMLKWNIEIAARECSKTGGIALDSTEPEKPAGQLLDTIEVPLAVAYGIYDETYTIAAMKHVAATVKGAQVKEFPTAHMVNMEEPEEFNKFLGKWLQANYLE